MPILEGFIIKGLIVVAKSVSGKVLAATTIKGITALGAAKFISASALTLGVIGALKWTSDSASLLKSATVDLKDGNKTMAAVKFAKLAVARLCCTTQNWNGVTPTPDAAMPWQPWAPWSGARGA